MDLAIAFAVGLRHQIVGERDLRYIDRRKRRNAMRRTARLLLLCLAGLCVAPAARADGHLDCPALNQPLFFNTLPTTTTLYLRLETTGQQVTVNWGDGFQEISTNSHILVLSVPPGGQVSESCSEGGAGIVFNLFDTKGAGLFVDCDPSFSGTVFNNRSGVSSNDIVTLENDTDQPATFTYTIPSMPPQNIPVGAGQTLNAATAIPPDARLDASCSASFPPASGINVSAHVM